MSFEDARNALLIAYADGFLDDEEFIVLYDYYQPVNPSFPYWNFDPFCLTTTSIPMPLFRFNFNFWTSGARAVHDR